VEYDGNHADRGNFHMLIIGDPGTGKSNLVERVKEIAWRSVGVSGSAATVAGTTAAAKQQDAMGGDWVLDPGAFVKANEGTVCIDELDDMPEEVRSAMLEPMSNQRINITKAGINTTLATKTSVIAAGNPKHGRFDPSEPVLQQFEFRDALMSRFDLVYTVTDQPDEEQDRKVGDHILKSREAGKRAARDDLETSSEAAVVDPPVDQETLRLWIGLANQQPEPVFASEAVRETLLEEHVKLRRQNGYDEDAPVPATHRKLEAQIRIAEAAARFELSDEITERHAEIAMEAVGRSMRDIEIDDDGQFDVDIKETGSSQLSDDKRQMVREAAYALQDSAGCDTISEEQIITEVQERDNFDMSPDTIRDYIDRLARRGVLWEKGGGYKFTG